MYRSFLAGLVLLLAAPAAAQFDPRQSNLDQTQNPSISFITDIRAVAGDATPDDLRFLFEGFELGVQAYANPFTRGDLYLGYHDGALEVEEGFALFSALPADLNLLAGLYRVGLGRFNIQHAHRFQFVEHPLLVTEYLGHEGYADVGLGPSLLLGLGDTPLTVSVDILDGARFAPHPEEDEHQAPTGITPLAQDEDEPRGRAISDFAFNGRGSLFLTLRDNLWLEVAGTAGTVVYDSEEELRDTWFGGDFKLKLRRDRRTSLTVSGEVVTHHRQVHLESGAFAQAQAEGEARTVTPVGAFVYADYQFNRRWNVGGLLDYAQTVADPDESQLGVGVFGGFGLFEESALFRLLLRHDALPDDQESEWSAQLQFIFSLGPHKPHQY